jgi:NAD(P)H-nitrite reductase large subunit
VGNTTMKWNIDIIILSIGVHPETTLARAAGLELGSTGGIKVNTYLQTSDPDIYAVGESQPGVLSAHLDAP